MSAKLRTVLMRHKTIVTDASLFAFLSGGAAAIFYLFDLQGRLSAEPHIDLKELLLLALVTGVSLFWFGWRRILEQERQIGRTREAERQARFLAHHDHLTGLPNRRRLQQALDEAVVLPVRGDQVHALLLLDLNGFKTVNDTYGHARGDEVLSIVASRMSRTLRRGDLLARTGGDEFAVVLHEVAGADGVARLATAIIDSFSDPIVVGSDVHPVGTGIGIALLPVDGSQPGELLRKADVALYKAKNAGHSSFAFYEHVMDEETRERDVLRRELALAIANADIVPHYQPIVDLETGELRAFEALARWSHPTLGVIPPAQFIPLAEQTGQIAHLSDQLLRRACADALAWPPEVDLAFNVSPTMLRDQTFGLRVLTILAEAGLPLGRVELEITEGAVTRDIEGAREALSAWHAAGLRVVLDDFGTGATSLAHLRSFKFDGLKIDRRFVDLMLREDESAAIVKAIVGLAGDLGLKIVAEGIEHTSQRSALRREGCSFGQGYLFGRAIPAAETHRYFARQKTRAAIA